MLRVVHDGAEPPLPLKGCANTQRIWNKFVSYPRGSDTILGDVIQLSMYSIQVYVRGYRGRSANDECTWNKSYQLAKEISLEAASICCNRRTHLE